MDKTKKTDTNIKSIDATYEQLKKEAEGWKAKYLRALADYQNLEKRVIQNREEQAKYAASKIIHELLTVLDTLEKAEKHLKDPGLTLGVKNFWAILAGHGIKRIETMGKKYDPHEMECLEVVEGEREDEVIEEIRPGYKLYDKIIRVAQVKVGKKKVDKKTEELAKKEAQKGNYYM